MSCGLFKSFLVSFYVPFRFPSTHITLQPGICGYHDFCVTCSIYTKWIFRQLFVCLEVRHDGTHGVPRVSTGAPLVASLSAGTRGTPRSWQHWIRVPKVREISPKSPSKRGTRKWLCFLVRFAGTPFAWTFRRNFPYLASWAHVSNAAKT